jgi:hypothetical protein
MGVALTSWLRGCSFASLYGILTPTALLSDELLEAPGDDHLAHMNKTARRCPRW